jgi:glycyl-tRNA synthetase
LGAELKRNVKDYWWRVMTRLRDDVVGLDATIIMHPKIWEASGHTTTFADPMVDCLLTKKRYRADQIEPQSGVAYHFSGAEDNGPPTVRRKSAKTSNEPYSFLVPEGKHPNSAPPGGQKFLQATRFERSAFAGGTDGKVQNSTRYNPENGSF